MSADFEKPRAKRTSEPTDTATFTKAEVRKNLAVALGRAHFKKEVVHITQHGKPDAAFVSVEDADLLQGIKERGWGEPLRQLVGLLNGLPPEERAKTISTLKQATKEGLVEEDTKSGQYTLPLEDK